MVYALALFLGNSKPVFSQSTPVTEFERDFQEYTLSLEEYDNAHGAYILARSQFLRFGTLTSRNNAKDATKNMLAARDEVVIRYSTAIGSRLREVSGVNQDTKDRISNELAEEIVWFEDHKNSLEGAGSLEDLFDDSDDARRRFNSLGPVIYEPLAQVPYGRVSRFHERLTENFLAIKDKVNEIRNEEREEYQLSARKLESIDGWIFETEERIVRSEEKLVEVGDIVAVIPRQEGMTSSQNRYNDVVTRSGVILQDLKDASLFIREIVRGVKTK